MRGDDGRERLLNAVEVLAVSADPLHVRLQRAGTALLPLPAGDFSDPEDGERLEEILRGLTGVVDPSGEHGAMTISAFAMSDAEAVRIAGLVVELFRRVAE
jgi:hypothetical protein